MCCSRLVCVAVTLCCAFFGLDGLTSALRRDPLSIGAHLRSFEVDNYFVAFSIDSSQLVGSSFWGVSKEFDFHRKDLILLAKALSPALLRIGGTDGDSVFYNLSSDARTVLPEGFRYALQEEQLSSLNGFLRSTGWELVFGLNAGLGPRGGSRLGRWDGTNAVALLESARSLQLPVYGYELGNEPNLWIVNQKGLFVLPSKLFEEFRLMRNLTRKFCPSCKIIGPDCAYQVPILREGEPITQGFISNNQKSSVIDVFNFHFYPLESQRCPLWRINPYDATEKTIRSTRYLSLQTKYTNEIRGYNNGALAAGKTPLWLGEGASASCGGEENVSDNFLSSRWYLDALGRAARDGLSVFVRQCLAGAPPYTIIHIGEDGELFPRPDYWIALLYKRLVGARGFDIGVAEDDRLRRYLHCSKDKGNLVIFAINLDDSDQLFSFNFRNSSMEGSILVDEYIVTPVSGDLRRLAVNGVEAFFDGVSVPSFSPVSLPLSIHQGMGSISVPAGAITFTILPDYAGMCK